MLRSKAPQIDFAVSNQLLTGSAGLALVASWLDLPCQLARRLTGDLGLFLRGYNAQSVPECSTMCLASGHN